MDFIVSHVDSATHVLKSLRFHGAKLWSNLPIEAKSADNIDDFKTALVNFKGIECKCAKWKFTQI